MKTTDITSARLVAFASLVLSGSALAAEVESGGRVFRDAADHERLANQVRELRAAGKAEDPIRELKPSEGEDPTKRAAGPGLLERSDFLCFGGLATLVPKRAIIHLPDSLAGVTEHTPGSQLVSWQEFFDRNRGWIEVLEIDRKTAEGTTPIPDETWERLRKGNKVVVATLMKGPVSVLPAKEPEAGEEVAAETTNPLKP